MAKKVSVTGVHVKHPLRGQMCNTTKGFFFVFFLIELLEQILHFLPASNLIGRPRRPRADPLETLLLDLSLSSGNSRVGVGVREATALLAVLGGGALGTADAHAARVDLGAALGVAVGVGDAPARGELGVLAVADVPGTGVVGGQGQSGDGDWSESCQRIRPLICPILTYMYTWDE